MKHKFNAFRVYSLRGALLGIALLALLLAVFSGRIRDSIQHARLGLLQHRYLAKVKSVEQFDELTAIESNVFIMHARWDITSTSVVKQLALVCKEYERLTDERLRIWIIDVTEETPFVDHVYRKVNMPTSVIPGCLFRLEGERIESLFVLGLQDYEKFDKWIVR